MKPENLIGGVVVLERDGKHFLIQQSENKPNSYQWRHPGGKFDPGETPVKGLIRETLEETGYRIDVLKQPIWVTESDYQEGLFGFFSGKVVGGNLVIDKREIKDAGWFAIEEIKEMELMNATKKFYERKFRGDKP